MNEQEKRVIKLERVEVREAGDEGPARPEIVGYAAVFNTPVFLWEFYEEIAPGAFSKTLASNPDIRATIEHAGGMTTIGRTRNGTLSLAEDERGLKVWIVPPDTQAGRDVLTLVREGYVNQMSFMFRVHPGGDEWITREDGAPLRRLKEIDLDDGDVSVVTYPAYPSTSAQVRDKAAAVREGAAAGEEAALARLQVRRAARRRKIQIMNFEL